MTVTDATPALWDAYAEACLTHDLDGAHFGTEALEADFWTEAEIITAEADAEESFRNAQLDVQREAELDTWEMAA